MRSLRGRVGIFALILLILGSLQLVGVPARAVSGDKKCTGFCYNRDNGPVATKPVHVYFIFWTGLLHSFPSGYVSTISQFVNDWDSTGAHGILSQYTDSTGTPVSNSVQLAQVVTDTSPLPTEPSLATIAEPILALPFLPLLFHPVTDADIQREVSREVSKNKWPTGDISDQYVVILPPGVDWKAPGRGSCAWHGNIQIQNAPIPYAAIGDPSTDAPDCETQDPHNGTPVALPGPFPNGEDLDMEISNLSHELSEMATDPYELPPTSKIAWISSDGAEIGDLCLTSPWPVIFPNRRGDGSDITLNGHRYLIQSEWSDAYAATRSNPKAAGAGCTLDSPLSPHPFTLGALVGQPYQGPVATFTDPDGESKSSDYQATISWGGASSVGTVTGTAASGYTVSGDHTFDSPGDHVVTVSITDEGGDEGPSGATAATDTTVSVAPVSSGGTGPALTASEGPLPPDAAPIDPAGAPNATSCPTATFCAFVGAYYNNSYGQGGFLETLSNGKWAVTNSGAPADANTPLNVSLKAVSCGAVGFCAAVGDYWRTNQGDTGALLSTLSGGIWTTAKAPLPADSKANSTEQLSGVSCSGPAFCVAIGLYSGGAFADVYDGSSWSAVVPPIAEGSSLLYTRLDGVSCSSSNSCIVVGVDAKGSSVEGFIDTLQGSTWTSQVAPAAPGGGQYVALDHASCWSSTSCTIAGTYATAADGFNRGVIMTMSKGSWSASDLPLPDGSGPSSSQSEDVQITSLSCASDGTCAVAGSGCCTNDGSGSRFAITDYTLGGEWTNAAFYPSFLSSGSYEDLGSVSCSIGSKCAFVGWYTEGGGTVPLVEIEASGVWSVPTAPLPAGANPSSADDELTTVDLRTDGSIVAVGQFEGTAGGGGYLDMRPLVETST